MALSLQQLREKLAVTSVPSAGQGLALTADGKIPPQLLSLYATLASPSFTGTVTFGGSLALSAGTVMIWNGDTLLYRLSAGIVKTDGQFYTGNFVAAAQGLAGQATIGAVGPGGEGGILFGSAGDTNLYRLGASKLKTDDMLIAALGIGVGNSASATVAVGVLARKIEVFDASGSSLGFVPVYASIT